MAKVKDEAAVATQEKAPDPKPVPKPEPAPPPAKLPRIVLCGPSKCGKDTAAEYLRDHTPLRFTGSTSTFLAPYVAKSLGLTVEEAFRRRHEDQMYWFLLGEKLRKDDPGLLAKDALKAGEILAGFRSPGEIYWLKDQKVIDRFVWIERDVPPDGTLKYGREVCDTFIDNNGTLEEYHARLRAFAVDVLKLPWRD